MLSVEYGLSFNFFISCFIYYYYYPFFVKMETFTATVPAKCSRQNELFKKWPLYMTGHEPDLLLALWILQKCALVTNAAVIQSGISDVMRAAVLQRT